MNTINRSLSLFLFITISIIPFVSSAQVHECDCKTDVEFLADRYQKDYSGFQDFRASHPDYKKRFQSFIKQSAKINDIIQCHTLIGEFIAYLNNGHVVFGALEDNPKFEELLDEENDNEDYDNYPTLDFPNSKSAVLTIKTGNIEYKSDLDSLIANNQPRLDSIDHLVIDLRGNSGGGDDTYNNVIPYIYTNPIVTYGATLWASENNIALFEQYLDVPNLPAPTKKLIESLVKQGKERPNTFIPFSETEADTLILDEIKEFPRKVSILIDGTCTSATEEFLLKAQQSSKTTIYGYESTGGALDYSNLNPVITPSGYWYATVPTTRSNRLPENPVDPHGIPPDVLVDKEVKDLITWVIGKSE